MAKGKKGKKGQEVKEGEAEQKDKLLEVDKEWYQIQIRSLEEKLERRNDKARALEVSNKEYQDRYGVLSIFEFFREIINFAQFFRFEQLREDKADVVAFLKRALQQRTDQISELQARLEGLQHVHETDGQAYEKKIADMKAEVSLFTFAICLLKSAAVCLQI